VREQWRNFFGEDLADLIAGDLEYVLTIEFAALLAEVADDLQGEPGAEIASDEGGLEVVPVEVGFAEAGEERFEEAGHG
jgi:hypothetical protein